MRYKIEELKDITDSREIMQSKPQGFSKYMMYIIIVLLALTIVWSLLANKEITVDASGEIRPNSEENSISSSGSGTVKALNYKDGDKVKKGDVLIELNNDELTTQKKLLEENLKRYEKDLENTKKLKQSISEGVNYFSNSDEDKEYYQKYEIYSDSSKDNNKQNNLISAQKQDLQKNIDDYNLLIKSIKDGKNYLSNSSSLYYTYEEYSFNINDYNEKIKNYEEDINNVKNDTSLEESVKSEQLKTLQTTLEETKSSLEKYKNSQNTDIYSSIETIKSKIKELEISSNSSNLKEQYISQLEDSIKTLENTISEIKMNIESYNSKINDTAVIAEADGVLNISSIVKEGDYLQAGTTIASLIPDKNEKYKVTLYIKNQDFGDIKNGQDINIGIVSLPKSEYGLVKAKISNISIDRKVDSQNGTSYYTAEAIIDKNYLTNKKGEKVYLKSGMLIDGKIVNRKVSYFRYFLEKINILN